MSMAGDITARGKANESIRPLLHSHTKATE